VPEIILDLLEFIPSAGPAPPAPYLLRVCRNVRTWFQAKIWINICLKMRYFWSKICQVLGNPLVLDPVGLRGWGYCLQPWVVIHSDHYKALWICTYSHKKNSVSCFYDRDGDSNHTPNCILSTYWNTKVL